MISRQNEFPVRADYFPKGHFLRYADGSNPLRWAESSIEWRHESFGDKTRNFRSGIAVRGQPALCPDSSAAVGGAGDGRFDNETGSGGEGENNGDEDESRSKDREAGSDALDAQEDCQSCSGENRRNAGRQGSASGADRAHQTSLCCVN